MKSLLLVWLLSFFMLFVYAQYPEFAEVDNMMENIPAAFSNSTDSIAFYINSNFKTATGKCRAAYKWVTFNIRYDKDSMYVFNWGGDPGRKVKDALRRKKGVCENYAAIFNEIAGKCGLISAVVSGYTKQYGTVDKAGHCWCAVKLNDDWLFCDPTWDEGFTKQANYFLIPPSVFIETHMPFDPLWQLLDDPVSAAEFYKGNLRHNKEKINYKDSVNAFLQLNELEQLNASSARIKKAGVHNELTRTRLAYMEMQSAIINESKDRNLYNSAVEDLNEAKKLFNEFIQYRDSEFIPVIPDHKMAALFLPVDSLITAINIKLDLLDKSGINVQYNTGLIRLEINKFKNRVKEQQDFLNKYLATIVTERKKLFYRN